MKKIALATTLLVLSLALVGLATTGALAQTDKAQLSMTGTIVKLTSDDIVLQTDHGQQRFDFKKDIEKPTTLAVGNKVTIWYDADDNPKGEINANKIEMFTEATPPPTTQAAPPPAQEPPPTETQTTTPSQETQTTQETPLPRTASPLPLMGAVGLLSLLGSGLLLRQPK